MKRFTQEEALETIFYQKGNALSAVMNVYKYRYKRGKLSQKSIDKILKNHNFTIVQLAMYQKVKEEDVRAHSKSDIHIAKGRQTKV